MSARLSKKELHNKKIREAADRMVRFWEKENKGDLIDLNNNIYDCELFMDCQTGIEGKCDGCKSQGVRE